MNKAMEMVIGCNIPKSQPEASLCHPQHNMIRNAMFGALHSAQADKWTTGPTDIMPTLNAIKEK
jgi:hypothetical protein